MYDPADVPLPVCRDGEMDDKPTQRQLQQERGYDKITQPQLRRIVASYYGNISLGKAGRSRWLGIRPQTRGTAMNPVDHPHGGGEGRNKGRHPVSPRGWPPKGGKTRKKRNITDGMIIRRRQKKRRKR